MLIALPVFLNSCNEYNFSEPQPADKENITEFPMEFWGTWAESKIDTPDQLLGLIPLKGMGYSLISGNNIPQVNSQQQPGRFFSDDSLSFFISRNCLIYIISGQKKINKGAWPKLDKQGNFVYPTNSNEWVSNINYDSLKKPLDTTENYFIAGNLIYEVTAEKRLGNGNRYTVDDDTITILKADSIAIDMGKNAFLRKLNDRFYVYNIRNWVLGEESFWWRIFLLEKTGINSMNIWECTSKTQNLPSMFYNTPSKGDIFYFNSKWPADEMNLLVKENYFEVSSSLVRVVTK
jgi:hypothetical protein